MLDETLIKRKHAEYYKKYSGQSIDDYDNYVMSRTIEYFYNKEQFPLHPASKRPVRVENMGWNRISHPTM